jgi:hypothetical protein
MSRTYAQHEPTVAQRAGADEGQAAPARVTFAVCCLPK